MNARRRRHAGPHQPEVQSRPGRASNDPYYRDVYVQDLRDFTVQTDGVGEPNGDCRAIFLATEGVGKKDRPAIADYDTHLPAGFRTST